MTRKEIYIKLVDAEDRKEKHLKQYADYIKDLAGTKSVTTFMSGHCSECVAIEKEISELEGLLIKEKI